MSVQINLRHQPKCYLNAWCELTSVLIERHRWAEWKLQFIQARCFPMLDTDTFLTFLYAMVDDFCKRFLLPEQHPGPSASLTCSEVVTLALFGQWQHFGSERSFYRYAQRHLRAAFPTLPACTQFNRLLRHHPRALVVCFLYLVEVLQAQHALYEGLDSTAVPTRDAKRRGAAWVGCPAWPILVGATAWVGMKASISCSRSIRWG
jgi:hypothetical protein